MKKILLIWATAIILVAVAIYVTYGFGKNKQALGDETIGFTLTDLGGSKVSLSDYKGKSVYLNFFATWCPPCKGEMPDIEKVYRKYKDKDFVVLAVDLGEDKNTVNKFIKENGYSFKVLLDSDNSISEKYQISSIPVSLFIDKNGNVVQKRVGALGEAEMEQYINKLLEK